jgi:hypothetical protein
MTESGTTFLCLRHQPPSVSHGDMVTKLQQKGKAAQLMNRNAQQLFGN